MQYLNLTNNKLTADSIPVLINGLPNIQFLNLSFNKIGEKGLKELWIAFKDKRDFQLGFDIVGAQSIPTAALKSWENLKEYFYSVVDLDRTVNLAALNILLLGNTTAGKSSFLDFYFKGGFDTGKKSTRGITHQVFNSILQKNLTISALDFGGQEYFHGTHRLFIGLKNALYLILWEPKYEGKNVSMNEIGDRCYPLLYWLGTVNYFDRSGSPEQRMLLIHSKLDLNENIPGKIADELVDSEGRFRLNIQNIFSLSVKGVAIPGHENADYYRSLWTIFRLRFEELILKNRQSYPFNIDIIKLKEEGLPTWRKDRRLFYSSEAFLDLCRNYYRGGDNLITAYLESCGEIFIFDNPLLKNKVFINPPELLNRIYEVLNEDVGLRGGFFRKAELEAANEEEAITLLDVMLEMELVFKDPSKEDIYIAPQYMSDESGNFPLIEQLRSSLPFAFSLRFPDFMPRACITQFISRKGKSTIDGVFWKFGVMYTFKQGGNAVKVLVESDHENKYINVHTDGTAGNKGALKEVFDFFAFFESYKDSGRSEDPTVSQDDYFHNNVVGIEHLELSGDFKNYATIKNICQAIAENFPKAIGTNGQYVTISGIFKTLIRKETATAKKIFFSYSRHERKYREEFGTQFSACNASAWSPPGTMAK